MNILRTIFLGFCTSCVSCSPQISQEDDDLREKYIDWCVMEISSSDQIDRDSTFVRSFNSQNTLRTERSYRFESLLSTCVENWTLDNRKIRTEIDFDSDGSVDEICDLYYHDDGRINFVDCGTGDFIRLTRLLYIYSESNVLFEKDVVASEGSITQKIYINVNAYGDVIEEQKDIDVDGTIDYVGTFDYDNYRNLISESWDYDNDSETDESREYFYTCWSELD